MTAQKHATLKRPDMPLMELLRGLLEYAAALGIQSFPPFNHRLWHEFLYEGRENAKEHPSRCGFLLDTIGEFDWDAPYPKNRKLGEVMFGLRLLCDNRSLENPRMVLKPVFPKLREGMFFSKHPHFTEAVALAFEAAKRREGFFE